MNPPIPKFLASSLLIAFGLVCGQTTASEIDQPRQDAGVEADADAVASRIRQLESQDRTTVRSDALNAVADDAAALVLRTNPDSRLWRRLQSDRLYALALAENDEAALTVYRTLVDAGQEVPDYVLPLLAQALQRAGQPAEALALMRGLAEARPDDAAPVIRLAYILNDLGRYPEARAELVGWLARRASNDSLSVEAQLSAELALVRIDRWNEALGLASERLDRLAASHADSDGWKAEAGALARAKGQPRYAVSLTKGVDSADARNVHAHAWLDLGRPDLADHTSTGDQQSDLRERIDNLRGGRGIASASYGNSRSAALASPNGADELALSLSVDSPWLASGWRIGGNIASHQADFHGATPQARYAGARVVRHGTGGESSLELGRSNDRFLPGSYAIGRADYWVTDNVRLGARLAVNDPQGPLQARASGIGSDALDFSVTYRPDHRWRVDSGAGLVHFDDGNRRNWGSLSGERRIVARAGMLTSAFVSAYASGNSLDAAPYFNPSRDTSLEAGVVHGFRGFADSWHSLRPSVALYWQEGFGTSGIPRLSYGVRIRSGAGRWTEARLAYARPVYDGQRETHWSLTLSHSWGRP